MGLVAALLLGACTNSDPSFGVSVLPDTGAPIRFSRDVQPIITRAGCTQGSCHGGGLLSAHMDLERPFDPTVGAVEVTSCEAPPMKRIARFDSENSYLVWKLEGRQKSATCQPCDIGFGQVVGDCGAMMPLGSATGLPASEIQTIRGWIDQGAQDN